MSSATNRTDRIASIPWVIAIVALFGLIALAPDQTHARKCDSSDEIGLSQISHDAQAPGRIFNPLVFLAPDLSDGIGSLYSSSSFLCIEIRRDLPLVPSLRGEVRGRAPPVLSLS